MKTVFYQLQTWNERGKYWSVHMNWTPDLLLVAKEIVRISKEDFKCRIVSTQE